MYRMASYDEPLLNELPQTDAKTGGKPPLPETLRRDRLDIPRLDERSLVRHYIHLSQMNYGVDTGIYPLGSCTMKYNPRLGERLAGRHRMTMLHPHQDASTVQGILEILHRLKQMLCAITGMHAFSLQPAAGAHGEFTGMLIARAYHERHGEQRSEVILPDSAHGTNPASAKMAGYDVVEISSREGRVDLDALREALSEDTAAFMLTNPNTLGVFERDILEIADMVKKAGALLYYDGANLNAIMGKARPGDMGFDIVHLNPHKTFATPHGGGGPGAGPVGVTTELEPYLPVPRVARDGDGYTWSYGHPYSIGHVSHFYGNVPVLLKTYAYLLRMGAGLQHVAEQAVLNANYLLSRLDSRWYTLPYPGRRMHEFVVSAEPLKERGVRALDLAKRLLDYGLHPPTMYFPLIVPEALMVEPTESESRASLDAYAEALNHIAAEEPELLQRAPQRTPVTRIDEAKAARTPLLTWRDIEEQQ
ncbi:MAG: aminomethyl-transferring glycine dehydrogenase subunit GcvPB [Thermoplasmatota archaeon]